MKNFQVACHNLFSGMLLCFKCSRTAGWLTSRSRAPGRVDRFSSFRRSAAERPDVVLRSMCSRAQGREMSMNDAGYISRGLREIMGRSHNSLHSRGETPFCSSFDAIRFLFIILLVAIATSSCEQPFEPIQENEQYFFSINGYLDASADTQWVRVMPVRESFVQEDGLPVPEVTLEHIESGESIVLHDSLFHFPGDRYAYNFWTTMPVLPENSYRVTVTGADGKTSTAETTLPREFPVPFFDDPEFGADILIIREVEQLADVQVVYRIRIDDTGEVFEAAFPYLEFSIPIPPETYRVEINPDYGQAHITQTYCGITVIERNVFVASGGPGWHDFVTLDRHTIALPDGISNVENGVGYLGGIISKTFPYINDEGEQGLFQVPCPS